MLSLYMASTGGEDWAAMGEPLWEAGWVFYGLFLFYTGFFMFVIMNTLMSLFVEATMSNAERDQLMIIQTEMEKKDTYIKRLQVFFTDMDENSDGLISLDEFVRHMDHPEVIAFANALEIDATDARLFFQVLSNEGQQSIDLETFVVGCMKLKGAAK